MNNSFSNIAIVVIAYNRINSLKRLLGSIYSADYFGDNVDLIISIDNSGSSTLADYASSLTWPHGKLKVITYNQRQGLKNHILKCGSLTDEYENICVLEDDIYVSPEYYVFIKAATDHFKNFEEIAGISLYTYEWNQYVNRAFTPINDGHDVYFMQVASSWGQVWNKKSWGEFIIWLQGKTDKDLYSDSIPLVVSNWSEKSWLKFHHKYLVDNNKFFVYPRVALSTNFSEVGEHVLDKNSTYQVPLMLGKKKFYSFPDTIHNGTQYDAFFESKKLHLELEIDANDIEISLYGNKASQKKYLLTTNLLNYKIINTYGLVMRPLEANVIHRIPGQGIYLYDTSQHEFNKFSHADLSISRFLYDIRSYSKNDLLKTGIHLYLIAITNRMKKFNVKLFRFFGYQ